MKLEIKNLSKNYGTVQALDDVSLMLDNGIYGLLGPNGAGKSTLISLLTDTVKREHGEIYWEGKEIRTLGKKYRAILGYMPQQQGYYEEFTAKAFLIYMGQLKGMNKKDAVKRAEEMLEIVNLKNLAKERIGKFSGGMKRRIMLAQAMMNDPKLLILDEPTAGVDPQERIRIRNFISEIAVDRIVLLATHIVSDVETVAKEIILMKKGHIIRQDVPYALMEEVSSKVYEIQTSQVFFQEVQRKYAVSSLRNMGESFAVRIIAEKPPQEYSWKYVQADLEDVYLYYFDEKVLGS